MATELKNISTHVLKTMIEAYSSYFEREMTVAEKIDCKMTNELIQLELDSRKLIVKPSNVEAKLKYHSLENIL